MKPQWYVLTDLFPKIGIAPVLFASTDPVIANQLRRGILDAHLFAPLNLEYVDDGSCGAFSRESGFCALPERMRTQELEEKRALLLVRSSGFKMWRSIIRTHLTRDQHFPREMGPLMARELERSSPDKPSEALLDYAHASGRSLDDVRRYFHVAAEEEAHRALMVHALAEKYALLINACQTAEEVTSLKAVMRRDFFI